MNSEHLRDRICKMGDLTLAFLAAAALALEMTPRTMSAYGTGARPVPRYVALACKGWELEHHR